MTAEILANDKDGLQDSATSITVLLKPDLGKSKTLFVNSIIPTENVFVCSRHQRLVTVVFSRCVQINLLTYLRTYEQNEL